jgi:starvation-inducible outer membrane lipoprotein
MLKTIAMVLTLGIFVTSCATVGAVIDGGKDLATSTVDSVVTTAGNVGASALRDVSDVVSTAADAAEGVVETVVTEVDEQTDALQEEKPE